MTIEEAAEIVRQRWGDCGGCRSCGMHPALYEVEPVEDWVTQEDIAAGFADYPCSGEYGDEIHRGIRVILRPAPDADSGQ